MWEIKTNPNCNSGNFQHLHIVIHVPTFISCVVQPLQFKYISISGIIFSRPTSFLQKSCCRVSSEKNILNSSVEWSRVEWKNWIKVISLFTFSHIFCLLSILSYEARMIIDIHTCVIRKSQSLTYCFFVYQYQYGHTRRT